MAVRIQAVHLGTGEYASIVTPRGARRLHADPKVGVNPESQLLRIDPTGSIFVEFDGHNVFVADLGRREGLILGAEQLEAGKRYVWLPTQSLYIGRSVQLNWEHATPAQRRQMRSPQTMVIPRRRGTRPRLPALRSLLFVRLPTAFHRPVVRGMLFALTLLAFALAIFMIRALLLQATGEQPSTPSPVTQATPAITVTITPTLIIAAPLTLTPTVVRNVLAIDTIVESEQASVAAPTPSPCQAYPWKPAQWDTRLDALGGIELTPACLRDGESFWRLIEARWFDVDESNGYHHIFIDLVDENGQRIADGRVHAAVSWPNGRCRPEPVERTVPIAHAVQCPMSTAGSAYWVYVEGLPGDAVQGLGLGTLVNRSAGELTSFYLKFQRMTYYVQP